jgi:hypothetical protein
MQDSPKEESMKGLNPWIKGFWLGVGAFWLAGPLAYGILGAGSAQFDFNLACLAFIATCIISALKFEGEQQRFEGRLTNRARVYTKNMDEVFMAIQKTMATAWKGQNYWELRAHDLSTGYMLYTYHWRETWDPMDNGKTLYHANMVVQCTDQSSMQGPKTFVSYSFDGNPSWRDRQPFYDAVHCVMGLLDSALPEHEVIKPAANEPIVRKQPVDREMLGV